MVVLFLVLFAGLAVGILITVLLLRVRTAGAEGGAATLAAQMARLEEQAARAGEFKAALDTAREQGDNARAVAAEAREKLVVAEANVEGQRDRIQRLEADVEELKRKREELAAAHENLQTLLAQTETTLKAERGQNVERLEWLDKARAELSGQFEALAGKILEEKSKRFTEQNQLNLGQILEPLKTRLTEFQSKVEEVQKEGIAGRSELRTHIDQLKSLNERLSEDATNLVSALRGSSKTQGDWGEFILESILEGCGLRKGEQYRVQETFTVHDEEGRRRARPDVILDLPEGKHLVIDAKVSLLDYNDYCNQTDEGERAAALARHLTSVRSHLKDLSVRNYQSLYGLKTLDFVVMFVPVEPAFMLAIANDSRLWQDAWNKDVLLVSPSTLLFVVRTVSQLWRQESQSRNVQEIVRRGGELYDKLAAFAKDLIAVGNSLDAAKQSYEDAYKKLRTGRGNAIRQAELLRSLGVKPTKRMPERLAEEALDESSDVMESEPLSFPEPPEAEMDPGELPLLDDIEFVPPGEDL